MPIHITEKIECHVVVMDYCEDIVTFHNLRNLAALDTNKTNHKDTYAIDATGTIYCIHANGAAEEVCFEYE
jgi:aspartate 1-decarboxylase